MIAFIETIPPPTFRERQVIERLRRSLDCGDCDDPRCPCSDYLILRESEGTFLRLRVELCILVEDVIREVKRQLRRLVRS